MRIGRLCFHALAAGAMLLAGRAALAGDSQTLPPISERVGKGDPPRANREKPLESLILVKPTDADMHEGGLRYKTGGWEYHVFRRWLEAGAKYDAKDVQKIVN